MENLLAQQNETISIPLTVYEWRVVIAGLTALAFAGGNTETLRMKIACLVQKQLEEQ